MDKELRRLIVEICSLIVLLVIVVPICVDASSDYRSKRNDLAIGNKASVDISNLGEYKNVKITSGADGVVKMNLIMKISKFSDQYVVYLDDQVYHLSDLEFTEDENYQYYNLGIYEVEKERVFKFKIQVQDKSYYDESISYSFFTEGMMQLLEDYTKYLSVDNGHGILISKHDAFLLEQYHIDYMNCSCLKDLILMISDCLDEDYDEELDMVLDHLNEVHYYQEINKQIAQVQAIFF